MARIRSIKPDFFHHEELAERSPLARLFFIGLWTLADKRGRLEDRPRRIKAALLPWEDCDVEQLLAELDAAGFIRRYVVLERAYIAIPGFGRHQRPHPKELDTGYPDPPSREISRPAVKGFSAIPSSPPGKGREGKEILVLGRETATAPSAPAAPPPPAPEELQAAWNENTQPPLPKWKELTPQRKKQAQARLRERPLHEWLEAIRRITESEFCRGVNDRGWVATPDWLLRPETATKVLEGKYDDRTRGPAPPRYLAATGTDEQFQREMADFETDDEGMLILK